MERLIYSNSIPCKPNPNSAFLPRHRKPSTAAFPLLPRLGLRRSGAFSCALNDSPLLPAKPGNFPYKRLSFYEDLGSGSNPNPTQLSFYEDSGDGSKPNPPHYLNWVSQKLSRQQKFTKAGIVILISTLFLTFLHPSTISPAFATLQSAAKTGAPTAVGNSLIRSELLSSAWTGFFAGCLHTLSGPDHLAALAPLSIGRTKMESAAVGALWGCGHDMGQLLFGLLFLLLKDRLHIEVIRTWGTRVVGLTLLVIGAMGIKEATEVSDVTDITEYENTLTVGKKKIGFATFATGIVHGLQPDALLIILPALALPSKVAGAAFLVMFLLGTVMAMGSYTVFIGSCSEALKERVPRITEKLTWASSLIAIGLGLALLVSQYFGFSLY